MWRAGDVVGPYKIEKMLGQGGMATVYKAYHPQLDRHVAVKVMHQNFLDDDNFHTRFQREARIVARLEHPHIVPVYDFNEQEGKPYLVMKFVEGQTLKQRLLKKALPLDDIIHIMRAVASALTYAHSKDVLHRDIKPSNIVIDNMDTPYLADFGLARIAQSGESTMSKDMVLGTPHYISPEQAKGNTNLDGRADIYSLGVVLYELMVGRVPFMADTPFAVIHDHIYTPLPMPSEHNPDITPSVEAILLRALSKDPKDRYQTADELFQNFEQALSIDGLKSLNDHRIESAQISLAKQRLSYDESFQQPSVETPILSQAFERMPTTIGESKQKSGTIYQKNPYGRYWIVGGIGAFLVICFIMLMILLSTADSFLELGQLLNNSETDAPIIDVANPDFYIELPDLSLEEAQALIADNPNEAIHYLLLAQAQLALGDNEEAYATVQTGLEFAESPIEYWTIATQVARNQDENLPAFGYALLAFDLILDSPQPYPLEREYLGNFLFETVEAQTDFDTDNRSIRELGQAFLLDDQIVQITNSPILRLLSVQNLLQNERHLVAKNLFERMPDDAKTSIEAQFIQAEIFFVDGKLDEAQRVLQSLQENPDTPFWILARSEMFFDMINSNEG